MRESAPGIDHADLLVSGLRCAGCIARIEKALKDMPGVTCARVNMSSRRVGVDWRHGALEPDQLIARLGELGYEAQPFRPEDAGTRGENREGRELLRALAVAGFATGNVMLLSVSVWSGAEAATRDLFHWLSALIALPAVVYAGRPFFRSAWRALAAGRLNMDVPISLAIVLASALSLAETIRHGPHAYFDAAVMLLFFLLIGRYLDHMMRARARSAVAQLLALSPSVARVVNADGSRQRVPVEELAPGLVVAVAAGERLPADGQVVSGESDLDRSLLTGESLPQPVSPGGEVHAGAMNLTGALQVRVTAANDATFLAEVVRLMEAAEQGKARYVRLADRAARVYAPLVHLVAALTFLGWLWATGGDWHASLITAIAVLIITCPCALGLAVPTVQVVAAGALFRRGVMVKGGAALEKLAAVDCVLFDKTGTLTRGEPALIEADEVPADKLALAAGLGQASLHPLARAAVTAAEARGLRPPPVVGVRELPGRGLEALVDGRRVRIGSRAWCGPVEPPEPAYDRLLELCLHVEGEAPLVLRFRDEMRSDAEAVIAALIARGLDVEMISGDRQAAVDWAGRQLGLARCRWGMSPQDKAAYVADLGARGRKVLMVGDGINDAPALAAAHVSMAPASAADVGRTAADLVFLGDALSPVLDALDVGRRADRLVRQNFALAVLYNLIAVPIAVLGLVTPLVAAIAMSSSSLVVTANALRLRPPRVRRARADTGKERPGDRRLAGERMARAA